jgi:hypothetical protein
MHCLMDIHLQFLDEPTSGLDARSATAVMAAVRNVAGNGRTVMVTIHQPSIEIFEAFDRLVLLGMGGEPIFVGPLGMESSRLVQYFEGIPGVSPLPKDYNPATWMLEVSGGSAKMHTEAVRADFGEMFRMSEMCVTNETKAAQIAEYSNKHSEMLALTTRYAATLSRQMQQTIWKLSVIYWCAAHLLALAWDVRCGCGAADRKHLVQTRDCTGDTAHAVCLSVYVLCSSSTSLRAQLGEGVRWSLPEVQFIVNKRSDAGSGCCRQW